MTTNAVRRYVAQNLGYKGSWASKEVGVQERNLFPYGQAHPLMVREGRIAHIHEFDDHSETITDYNGQGLLRKILVSIEGRSCLVLGNIDDITLNDVLGRFRTHAQQGNAVKYVLGLIPHSPRERSAQVTQEGGQK